MLFWLPLGHFATKISKCACLHTPITRVTAIVGSDLVGSPATPAQAGTRVAYDLHGHEERGGAGDVQGPRLQVNGLDAVAEGLWLCDQRDDRSYLVDYSGKVLSSFASPARNASGITFGARSVWVASNIGC